ncbi:MAG: manganese efflux pump [Clostridia bacterium]|nr:manganese efflux pump [Clostridia bacterium]
MLLLTTILTGIGLSMDAFAVSVTNGMCSGKLKFRQALADGLTFGFFQALMPLIGLFFGLYFMKYIEAADHWIAFILLAGIGINMIRGALKKDEEVECAPNPYTVKNLLVQGIATSIDALAVGVGLSATMSGYGEALFTVGVIGVCTFLISTVGVYIGKMFGGMLKEKAEIFGGVILIGIGMKILIEHLFF